MDYSTPFGYGLMQTDSGGETPKNLKKIKIVSHFAPDCSPWLSIEFAPMYSEKKTERGRRADIVRQLKKLKANIEYMVAFEEKNE